MSKFQSIHKNLSPISIRFDEGMSFLIENLIAEGQNCHIYSGKQNKNTVAIKTEIDEPNRTALNSRHFAKIIEKGKHNSCNYVVTDILGPNLRDLALRHNPPKFKLLTLLKFAYQTIEAMQALHQAGFIHRAIEARNFAIGYTKQSAGTIFLIDFSKCRKISFNNASSPQPSQILEQSKHKFNQPNSNYSNLQLPQNDFSLEYTQNKDDFTPFNDLIGIMNIISEYYSGKDTVAEIINSMSKEERELLCQLFKIPSEFIELYNAIKLIDWNHKPDYTNLLEIVQKIAIKNQLNLNQPFEWEFEMQNKSKILLQKYYQQINKNKYLDQNNPDYLKSSLNNLISSLPLNYNLQYELSSTNLLQNNQQKINIDNLKPQTYQQLANSAQIGNKTQIQIQQRQIMNVNQNNNNNKGQNNNFKRSQSYVYQNSNNLKNLIKSQPDNQLLSQQQGFIQQQQQQQSKQNFRYQNNNNIQQQQQYLINNPLSPINNIINSNQCTPTVQSHLILISNRNPLINQKQSHSSLQNSSSYQQDQYNEGENEQCTKNQQINTSPNQYEKVEQTQISKTNSKLTEFIKQDSFSGAINFKSQQLMTIYSMVPSETVESSFTPISIEEEMQEQITQGSFIDDLNEIDVDQKQKQEKLGKQQKHNNYCYLDDCEEKNMEDEEENDTTQLCSSENINQQINNQTNNYSENGLVNLQEVEQINNLIKVEDKQEQIPQIIQIQNQQFNNNKNDKSNKQYSQENDQQIEQEHFNEQIFQNQQINKNKTQLQKQILNNSQLNGQIEKNNTLIQQILSQAHVDSNNINNKSSSSLQSLSSSSLQGLSSSSLQSLSSSSYHSSQYQSNTSTINQILSPLKEKQTISHNNQIINSQSIPTSSQIHQPSQNTNQLFNQSEQKQNSLINQPQQQLVNNYSLQQSNQELTYQSQQNPQQNIFPNNSQQQTFQSDLQKQLSTSSLSSSSPFDLIFSNILGKFKGKQDSKTKKINNQDKQQEGNKQQSSIKSNVSSYNMKENNINIINFTKNLNIINQQSQNMQVQSSSQKQLDSIFSNILSQFKVKQESNLHEINVNENNKCKQNIQQPNQNNIFLSNQQKIQQNNIDYKKNADIISSIIQKPSNQQQSLYANSNSQSSLQSQYQYDTIFSNIMNQQQTYLDQNLIENNDKKQNTQQFKMIKQNHLIQNYANLGNTSNQTDNNTSNSSLVSSIYQQPNIFNSSINLNPQSIQTNADLNPFGTTNNQIKLIKPHQLFQISPLHRINQQTQSPSLLLQPSNLQLLQQQQQQQSINTTPQSDISGHEMVLSGIVFNNNQIASDRDFNEDILNYHRDT